MNFCARCPPAFFCCPPRRFPASPPQHPLRRACSIRFVPSADGQQPVRGGTSRSRCSTSPQLPAGRPGAQRREIPGRKIDARAVLRLRTGVASRSARRRPAGGYGCSSDAASVCQCHRFCPSFHQRHRAPGRGAGTRCLSQTASSAASAVVLGLLPGIAGRLAQSGVDPGTEVVRVEGIKRAPGPAVQRAVRQCAASSLPASAPTAS